VRDMPDGDFVLVDVDPLGNQIGWEGKNLLNAIGILVRKHQCARINCLSWKDMHESYITNILS
jgi:transcription antitermination factor NusA-like protein